MGFARGCNGFFQELSVPYNGAKQGESAEQAEEHRSGLEPEVGSLIIGGVPGFERRGESDDPWTGPQH